MQHDVTDAVLHLIGKNLVDPKRICIFGASYGGYVAMAGLAFTPDLYACGISYAGVSDLCEFIRNLPKHLEIHNKFICETIGDLEVDKKALLSSSPLHFASQIRSPLLLIHGDNDARVLKEQSSEMAERLKSHRPDLIEYAVLKNEGHNLLKESSRLHYYGIIDGFLRKHIYL